MEPTIVREFNNANTSNLTRPADCSISARFKFVTFGVLAGQYQHSPCDLRPVVDRGFLCEQLAIANSTAQRKPGHYVLIKKGQIIHLALLFKENATSNSSELIIEQFNRQLRPFGIIDTVALPFSFGYERKQFSGNFSIHQAQVGRRTLFVAGQWALL